jgi:hypothetical protein
MIQTKMRILGVLGVYFVVLIFFGLSGSSYPSGSSEAFNYWARASPNPAILGQSITCIGLTNNGGVASTWCGLFNDNLCPLGQFISGHGTQTCVQGRSSTSVSPPTFGDVPGGCKPSCHQFSVGPFILPSSGAGTRCGNGIAAFEFLVKFFSSTTQNSDTFLAQQVFTFCASQSLFVIPESPIGAIVLTISSIGAVGVYLLIIRFRRYSIA